MQGRGTIATLALIAAAAGFGVFSLTQTSEQRNNEPIVDDADRLAISDDRRGHDRPPIGLRLPEPVSATRSFDEQSSVAAVQDVEQEEEVVDPSGMSKDEKVQALLRSHELFMASTPPGEEWVNPGAELSFAARAVATILREQGRADYGDPAQIAEGRGFKLRSENPDEHVFAADRARYTVRRGEFPALDLAHSRAQLRASGGDVQPLSDEGLRAYEQLLHQSLRSLGIEPQGHEQGSRGGHENEK